MNETFKKIDNNIEITKTEKTIRTKQSLLEEQKMYEDEVSRIQVLLGEIAKKLALFEVKE